MVCMYIDIDLYICIYSFICMYIHVYVCAACAVANFENVYLLDALTISAPFPGAHKCDIYIHIHIDIDMYI